MLHVPIIFWCVTGVVNYCQKHRDDTSLYSFVAFVLHDVQDILKAFNQLIAKDKVIMEIITEENSCYTIKVKSLLSTLLQTQNDCTVAKNTLKTEDKINQAIFPNCTLKIIVLQFDSVLTTNF